MPVRAAICFVITCGGSESGLGTLGKTLAGAEVLIAEYGANTRYPLRLLVVPDLCSGETARLRSRAEA